MAEIRVTANTAQAERQLASLGDSLKALSTIAFGGAIAQQIVAITSNVQELTNKLIFATGSIEQANKTFALLAQTAQTTGSNLGGTTDLFQKLAQSATFAGSSNEALAKITENFNKTLQISGASGAGAASALYQFAQAMQKGTLNGDEFRTIMETNGYLLKVLEKQTGKSRVELIKMASDGKLSAEIVGKALYDANSISQDYDKTIRTIPQAFENLNTALTVTIQKINQATGFGNTLVAVLEWFANNIPTLIGGVLGLAGAMVVLATRIAAVRAAMISTGWGALIVAAGMALGYAADQMGLFEQETKKVNDGLDEQTKTAQKGLVTTRQKTQQEIDYAEKLNVSIRQLKAQNDITERGTGLKSLQIEVEKAIAQEREKARSVGAALSAQDEKRLRTENSRKILIDEEQGVRKRLQEINSNLLVLGTQDVGQKQVLKELESFRLGVTKETYNLYKDILQNQIEQTIQAQSLLDYEQQGLSIAYQLSNLNLKNLNEREAQNAVDAERLKLGSLFTAEMEAQIRQNVRNNQLLKERETIEQAINKYAALGRKQSERIGAGLELLGKGQTQQQANAEYLRQLEDLAIAEEALRQQGLANEQAYLNAKEQLRLAHIEKIHQINQRQYEEEFRNMGFSNKKSTEMANKRVEVEKMSRDEQMRLGLEYYGEALNSLGTFNKDAFKIAKAFNIAMAIMDTYKAAQSAFAALAGIPVVGPALGAVAAAAAIAAGMARVAAIRSQSFSGRALGGPVMGGDSYIVGESGPEIFTPNTTGSITPNSQIGGDNVNINFNINTVDARGFDQLLAQRKPMIIQMVRTAMNDKGNRSLV